MKAAQISEYGDPSVVKIVEVKKPEVKPGYVLVKVQAAGLNPYDTTVRSGSVKDAIPQELPITLGGDIAGIVAEVGPGVTGFNVGDIVYGQANVVAGNSGAFAEYAVTKAEQIGKAPSNLSIQEAASISLIGVSALQALTQHIDLKSGQKIFITGGAGGIGSIAIQLSKHLGAYVATSASGGGIEIARSLGADEVFDYKTQDYTQSLSGYDAAYDTVGGDELERIVSILKDGGIAVSMAGQPEEKQGIISISQGTVVNTSKLNNLKELIEKGVIKPKIGKMFPLDEVQDAFRARESGAISGKIVLDIS